MESTMSQISSGRIRALAVTGSRRLKYLPDVPSVAESGVKGLEGIDPYTYYALAGPVGLPAGVVSKLNDTINRVSKTPAVAAQPDVRSREVLDRTADAGQNRSFLGIALQGK